jgi:hypothetical protein
MDFLPFIFLALAASFNGVMDTLLWHYPKSVFKNLPIEWWNPNYSWMSVKNFLGIVRLDAWHLAKYGMLFSICLAIFTYKSVFGYWDILIMPCIWSISFELFYSFILKSKPNTP